MRRDLIAILAAALLAAACSAQEPPRQDRLSGGALWVDPPSGEARILTIAREWDCARYAPNQGWLCQDSAGRRDGQGFPLVAGTMRCNALHGDGSCSSAQEPIVITPGETTIGPPVKIMTLPMGIPCDPADRMVPGCLPAEMQGWVTFIFEGTEPQFRITFEWADADGKERSQTQIVDRTQGTTVAVWRVGRPKTTYYGAGTVAIRTRVESGRFRAVAEQVVEHERD